MPKYLQTKGENNMDEKNFAEAMAELAEKADFGQIRKKKDGVCISMSPDKVHALAILAGREEAEKAIGTFLTKMLLQFYGVGKAENLEAIPIVHRAKAGDEQAQRILGGVTFLAEAISYDILGMEYDLDD